MLLSIAIPAYARPKELRHALNSLIRQILLYEGLIEILVVDDASPDDPLGFVADLARRYGFIRYTRLEENIGLERNLISCAKDARGEYLWIFGDDDFLETADALDEIVSLLRSDRYDVLVLNRTRRSSDLSTLMTENWMRLNGGDRDFSGLREFCLEFGFISVIGFITANIFRRVPFAQVDSSRYLGTMYPQLGSMLEAFHDKPVRLIAMEMVHGAAGSTASGIKRNMWSPAAVGS